MLLLFLAGPAILATLVYKRHVPLLIVLPFVFAGPNDAYFSPKRSNLAEASKPIPGQELQFASRLAGSGGKRGSHAERQFCRGLDQASPLSRLAAAMTLTRAPTTDSRNQCTAFRNAFCRSWPSRRLLCRLTNISARRRAFSSAIFGGSIKPCRKNTKCFCGSKR